MTIDPVKKNLFTVDTVFTRPVVKRNPLIASLDTRIYDIALQIIGITALSIAAGGAIAATVAIGWTLIPTVMVISLAILGSASLYVRSGFQRYHNTYCLSKHQAEAMHLSRKLSYLDQVDFLQGRTDEEKKIIKKNLLKPLSILTEKHTSLETILRYSILSPAEFKKAFDLETKYLELPEAFDLYTQVRKAAEAVPGYDISAFKSTTTINEWNNKLASYFIEQTPKFDTTQDVISPQDPLEQRTIVLQKLINVMRDGFKYGILTENQQLFERFVSLCVIHQKQYKEFVHKNCPEIEEKRKLEKLRTGYYENHSIHSMICREQQSVLKGIEDIQAEQERKVGMLQNDYRKIFEAIESRKTIDSTERADDEEQRIFFTNKMRQEESLIAQEYQTQIERYMQKGISTDFLDMLHVLKSHKASLDRTYNDTLFTNLERPINDFIRSYSAKEITHYKRLFDGYFLHLQQMILTT